MPARTPDAVKRPAGPSTVPPKAAAGPEPPGAEVLVGSEGRNGDIQTHHAALLADPRLDNRAGDGQRIRLLQALQRTYGNAHVAGVIAQLRADEAAKRNGNGKSSPTLAVQLQGAVACPAPPKEPVATPPHQDPNFRSVGGEAKKGAATLKRHDPAQKKVTEAQDAAKAPPDDIESQSKAAKTDTMSTAKPGTFDKAAFMAAVRTAIEAKAPKNLDEADKFASSGNADVKGEVTGKVTQSKEGATKDVKAKTEAPPDPSKAKPKDVKPAVEEKPGPRPPDPAGARAMPSPAPAEEKNLGGGTCEVDSQMKEADVTEEQLAKSNEPEFTGALKDKKEAEKHTDTAPAKVEHQEKAVLEGAKKGAAADAQGSMTAMYGAKKGATEKLGATKTKAQTKDEAERAKVSGEIKAIYDRTETEVKGILEGLDKKVDTAFDKGEADAKSAFTQRHESEMKAYKEKRYEGWTGKARWVKDKLLGLPEEANQIYIRARDTVYLPKMDKVISDVADIVGGELTRAKQRIEQGRAEIKKYVAGLPANLKKFGAEAQKEFSSKFDELEQSVDDKQSEMVDKLATKYVEARDRIDEEIKKMQEANKGLIAKVVDAIGGVIKTILELKNLLMGVLARVAGVIGKILKDPIGFLGNLISGVKGGLQAFLGNIAEHLKKGVVGWLLGNMRGAGLELPAKFDLKGIIGMLASLLGLTWAAIRGRVIQRGVPEQAMVAAEKAVPEAETLKNEGVAGLWQKIAARIGDIKEMILTKLREYLVPTIIMAGITWIISLLNPASAFIKAVKAIIDIVRFIFERAAQLFEFINAVLDAIVTIAGGAIGGAVKAIEGALAKSIPVLIGFLAALLGIGGLANKVKSIFQALSKPVMKVIDKIVDFIVKTGKKLWAKMRRKFGKKKGDKRKEGSGISRDFEVHGEHHRAYTRPVGGQLKTMVASNTPLELVDFVGFLEKRISDLERRPSQPSASHLREMRSLHSELLTRASPLSTILPGDRQAINTFVALIDPMRRLIRLINIYKGEASGAGRNHALVSYRMSLQSQGLSAEATPTISGTIRGLSGSKNPPDLSSGTFFTIRDTGDQVDRRYDTERKLLEYIAHEALNAFKLPSSGNPPGPFSQVVGQITLVSDLPICPSCRGVIEQFRGMFRGRVIINTTSKRQ